MLLAQCHHRDNALAKAARQYRSLVERAGGRYAADAMHGLASVLYQMGESDDAESASPTTPSRRWIGSSSRMSKAR